MNFKRFTLCVAGACACMGMMAVPAKRGVRTFTQADGSVISLMMVGDEYFHTLTTTDGLAVQRKADGNFYYRLSDGVTDIVAHNVSERTPAEKLFIGQEGASLTVDNLVKAASSRIKSRRANATSPRKATQVPNNGSPRIPILLVQYSDYKFKDADPKATFQNFFDNGETSAYQYFVDQSNGKYTPQFDVYGPITLSGTRATYGGNDYWGDDKGVGQMVAEGCLGLDSQINFKNYDNDGDGECDVVIVLYAGDGEASSYEDDCEDAVWPCQWALSSSDYNKSLTLDNTLVNKFAVFNELYGQDLTKIDGIGTFCHEFSHCLGLPDFYDTNYSGFFGMGDWSLLDSGSYNNDGFTPIGYSAYEKEFMGWIEIEEATENTFYTLPIFNQKSLATDKAIKITNSKDANEYYIIENRAPQGWDKYIYADGGLFIYHVTYNASAWSGNTVNNYSLQRMTPIPADNLLKMDRVSYYGETYYLVNTDDEAGDLWPYGNATELTDTSVPAAKVNTGSFMGKPVTAITKNSDGTVSFWFMKAPKPTAAQPVLGEHGIESRTSFTANWVASADEDVTYTLEVKEHKDITYALVMSADFSADNHGWSTTGYTACESIEDGTRLGSNKQMGSLTSPSFNTAEDGIVTVFLNAKYYGTDASSIKVSLLNAAGTAVDSKTVALGASYGDYTFVLNGTANSSMKVKIETVANKKRAYIHSADIYTGDASEAKAARAMASESGDELSRVITGITGTSYTVTGLKTDGVYDYRVKAVPNDSENFDHSAWTEYGSVNLSNYSGVESVIAGDNENVAPEFYNLQGVKVAESNLIPGVYVVKRGTSVSKVLVK